MRRKKIRTALVCLRYSSRCRRLEGATNNATGPSSGQFHRTLTDVNGKPLTIVGVTFSIYNDQQAANRVCESKSGHKE